MHGEIRGGYSLEVDSCVIKGYNLISESWVCYTWFFFRMFSKFKKRYVVK
jgi:hypothetical protein